MCGLISVWNREGVFPYKVFDKLFTEAEKRGEDGFGIFVINTKKGFREMFKSTLTYKVERKNVKKFVSEYNKIGSLFIGNFRAQPETEVQSTITNLQPIWKDDIVISHNGSVSNKTYKSLKEGRYKTQIDSEAIINAYIKFGGDMKKVMEYLNGGFAFILYDNKRRRLYHVTDYKPLASGYIRPYGYIIHSNEGAISSAMGLLTDCNRCGYNVWEDYYYHTIPGYTIVEIDIDSGMERQYNFTPNFYHPTFDGKTSSKEAAIVICSGGIDSTLSAYVSKLVGYSTTLLHFTYGQKSEESEKWAVKKLSKQLDIPLKIVDLKPIYKMVNDPSSLIRKDIEVTTGTEDDIKSTQAWVANRNQIFLSIATTLAESIILNNKYKNVYIVGGFTQLTESGHYPDNSEKFLDSFFENIKYSTIVGSRIKPLPIMQNIMKSEEWILGKKLNFPFQYSVSCDVPIYDKKKDEVRLCRQCGSTLLSMWAAKMAGVKDPRKFYDRKVNQKIMKGKISKQTKLNVSYESIVGRLLLPQEKKKVLLNVKKD
tara:strand:- start:20290 stop:21906 length:1617 start_codon:yes stop_codon:yes gene_type:complete